MKIVVKPIEIEDMRRIAVYVAGFDPRLPAMMKQVQGSRYSMAPKCWHIPYSAAAWGQLVTVFEGWEIERPNGQPTEQVSAKAAENRDYKRPLPAFRRDMGLFALYQCPHNSDLLWLHLPHQLCEQYLPAVKNIHGRKWNSAEGLWELPYTQLTLRFLDKYMADAVQWKCARRDDVPEGSTAPHTRNFPENGIQYSFVPAKYEAAVTALEQNLTLMNYSYRTIKSYKNCFRAFIRHYDDTKPSQLTRKQIDQYIYGMLRERNISRSHQNQILSAIKFFYSNVMKQEEKVRDLLRPRKAEKLPNVLTQEEVARFLRCIQNMKHRCIMMLIYSGGLRLGEVTNLKIKDIQIKKTAYLCAMPKGKKIGAPFCQIGRHMCYRLILTCTCP